MERHFITFRAVLPDELSDIADWFEVNYVSRYVARRKGNAGLVLRRLPARYPPRSTSQSLTILHGLTTYPKAGTADSNMPWENKQACTFFFEELKKEQEETEGMLRHLGLG